MFSSARSHKSDVFFTLCFTSLRRYTQYARRNVSESYLVTEGASIVGQGNVISYDKVWTLKTGKVLVENYTRCAQTHKHFAEVLGPPKTVCSGSRTSCSIYDMVTVAVE